MMHLHSNWQGLVKTIGKTLRIFADGTDVAVDDNDVDAVDVNDLEMIVLAFPSPWVAAVAFLKLYLYVRVRMFDVVES